MDEGFMFLLGVCVGGLVMLFTIIRIIADIHSQMEQNPGKAVIPHRFPFTRCTSPPRRVILWTQNLSRFSNCW